MIVSGKKVVLGVAGLIIASSLAGCGGSNDGAEAGSEITSQAEAEAKYKDQPSAPTGQANAPAPAPADQ